MGSISRGDPAVRLWLVAVVLAVMLAAAPAQVLAACESRTPPEESAIMTEVFAQTEWYREKPEAEQEYRGKFQRREVAAGPAARTALRYTLVTDASSLAVYAPNNFDTLEAFVGRRVVVWGKVVDRSADGSGTELWIGSIGPREENQ